MIKRDRILEIIEDNRHSLKRLGVKRIGIFGSFARNTSQKDSDVDVLVEFRPGKKTFDNYMDIKELLEGLLKRKVDLVVREAIKSRFKPSILKDAQYAGL
ncbi:MAG: nucleotidyltransferase family protein [Candidatus Omnitrophica bacterium]|nr:nucleotidyltransferase family protein [Candidatus Omnitrophota bacterium]